LRRLSDDLRRASDRLRRPFSDLRRPADGLRRLFARLRRASGDLRRPKIHLRSHLLQSKTPAWLEVAPEKSGGGPPQSKTLARFAAAPDNAKRLGLRQSPGALGRVAGPKFRLDTGAGRK